MSAQAHAATRSDAQHGYMRITIPCPHCLAKATAVDSVELSPTLREITYRCNNWRCGHVYVASLEAVRTLAPSAAPAPDVRLPVSRLARREQLAFELAADPEADYAANLFQPMSDWGTVTAHCRAAGGGASTGGAERYLRITTACPHCRARAVAIDSREMSRTMREVTYRCSNWLCRHVYVTSLEVLRTLSLSSMPAMDVNLPLDAQVRRERVAVTLARADTAYQAQRAAWAAPPPHAAAMAPA